MTEAIALAVVFKEAVDDGSLSVIHGRLGRVSPSRGRADGPEFGGSSRVDINVEDAMTGIGAFATRITVRADGKTFTFFPRDLTAGGGPLLVRDLGVAVVAAEDKRSYAEIDDAVREKGLIAEWQRIEAEPEENYESACRGTRDEVCPTWLGLSRDLRLFRVSHDRRLGYVGCIEPAWHGIATGRACNFAVGRGASAVIDIVRRLDDGTLPILHAIQRDDTVEYHMTAFATLETQVLTPNSLRGSHWLAAYANGVGQMMTEEEIRSYGGVLKPAEILNREEEVVCRVRVRAANTDAVPRYAYFMAGHGDECTFHPASGGSLTADGKALCASLIEGEPMPQSEMAVLLQPGASMLFDVIVPHQPISAERMDALLGQDYDEHLAACRRFWLGKLAAGAQISVPEAAIDERLRAGLLHCDLVTLGMESEGPLLANVGVYTPIGSESSPIIQFFDSLGLHKTAERCIDFFLVRQRDDGFIQNFGEYQLETGPTLWTIGEHFRYTRDEAWALRIRAQVAKACDYLIHWRRRNHREELRGQGYGLLDGKVADPPDFFHSFMLNGLSYLGLKRIAEMYQVVDPALSANLTQECECYLADIRTAYLDNVARSPIVPLGDGAWVPSFGPWAEYPGPVSLYAEGGNWHTHGAFASRDALIGALYLLTGEVLDPCEPAADWLLHAHQELMTVRNAGLSQPYYCRHDWAHLKRGEVKQFLKTYYTQMAALQDRETYTFWEHYFGASQHKTHEEAWFLMQSRWMLWDEDWDTRTLRLLSMIPRRWLESGRSISLKQCVCYFGKLDLDVHSDLEAGEIRANVACRGEHGPASVRLRLPHPEGLRPSAVRGGRYDDVSESVVIEPFAGSAGVVLTF